MVGRPTKWWVRLGEWSAQHPARWIRAKLRQLHRLRVLPGERCSSLVASERQRDPGDCQMSRIIASNYIVSSGIAIDLVTANEYAYVAAGVTAGSENGTAIVVRADRNQVENFGSLVGLVGIVASGGAALNTRIL